MPSSSRYDWDRLVRYLHNTHEYPLAVLHTCSKTDLAGLYNIVTHTSGNTSARHSFDPVRDRRQTLAFVSARTASTCAELEDMSLKDFEAKVREAIDYELGRLPCDHPKARCHARMCSPRKKSGCTKSKSTHCAPHKCPCKVCTAKVCKAKVHKTCAHATKDSEHSTSAFEAPKVCKHACVRSRTPSPTRPVSVSKQCMASPTIAKCEESSDSDTYLPSSHRSLPPICTACGVRHGTRRRRSRRSRRVPSKLADASLARRRSLSSSSSSSSSSSFRARLSSIPKLTPIAVVSAKAASPTVLDEASICSQPVSSTRLGRLQSPAVPLVESTAAVTDGPAVAVLASGSRRSASSSSSSSSSSKKSSRPAVAIMASTPAATPVVANASPPQVGAAIAPVPAEPQAPASQSPAGEDQRVDAGPSQPVDAETGPPQGSRPPSFPPPGMQSFDEAVMHGEVIPIVDDGSAGFSAIGTVLSECREIGYHRDPRELRQMLAERLPSYWDEFFHNPKYREVMSAIHNYNGLDRAVNIIRHPETWLGSTLGEFELIVIASEFEVIIRVVSRDEDPDHDPDGPPNYVSLTSPRWPSRVQAPVIAEIVPVRVHLDPGLYHQLPVVYLLYENNHYSPIIPSSR